MKSLVAGLAAAAAAYVLNRFLIEKAGNKGMNTLIPISEEALKTLAAVFFGAPLIQVHSVFGALEAGYEILGAGGEKGVLGGILSFAAHSFLGLVTVAAFQLTRSLLLSIFAASVVHSMWNRVVTYTYTRN